MSSVTKIVRISHQFYWWNKKKMVRQKCIQRENEVGPYSQHSKIEMIIENLQVIFFL